MWFVDLGLSVGWGISAFSSTPIRWSTCMAFMVPFIGLRLHCWDWPSSRRCVTTHVVLRVWAVIPGFCNRAWIWRLSIKNWFLLFFLCVLCLLVSKLLSGSGCPSLWCALVVVSSIVLVALASWLWVSSMASASLFSGEYSLLVVIRLLR